MSQTPPPPPETPPGNRPGTQPPLRPDEGELPELPRFEQQPETRPVKAISPEQVSVTRATVETPAVKNDTLQQQQGGNGCLWALGGIGGCLGVVVLIIGGLIFAAGLTVQGFVNEVTGIFDPTINARNITLPVVERIEFLSELITTRRNYSEIATAETEMPGILQTLYGESVILVVVGQIEAGIDLNEFNSDDISLDAETGVVTVNLPAPIIRACYLDESQTQVVERSRGAFSAPAGDVASAAREFALNQFGQMALEDGILQDAQDRAETVISDMMRFLLNDEDVPINIIFEPIPADPALPDACR